MDKLQTVVQFVNAHRDACLFEYVVDELISYCGLTKEEAVDYLKSLRKDIVLIVSEDDEPEGYDHVFLTEKGYELLP